MQGNPVQCYLVDEVHKSIGHAAVTRGDLRSHSKAITAGDLNKIYQWSSGQCNPDVLLKKPILSADEVSLLTLHLYWLAFSSLAFTIWTRYGLSLIFPCLWLFLIPWLGFARNMEHSNLCLSDIDWNHVVPHHHVKHVQINLTRRKDEQRKASKGESRVDELRGVPSIYMFAKL